MSRKDKDNERTGISFISVLLSLLILALIVGFVVFKHYYNMMETHKAVKEKENVLENIPKELPSVDDLYSDDTEDIKADAKEENKDGVNAPDFSFDMDMDGIRNVLIVGVDTREDDYSGRSDAMILLSVDRKTKKILMTSLLRDIYVSIPDNGHNRLNAAYAFGGTELLKDTVYENFGIPIDNTIVINFFVIKDFVDAVGGLDVELSADEIVHMNSYVTTQSEDFGDGATKDRLPEEDGVYHLNGNQALAYARVRYVGTDFGRTARQRTILTMSLDKVKDMSLKELNDLAESVLPKLRTDMDEMDCLSFILSLALARGYDSESMAIPVEGMYTFETVDGMSIINVDFEQNTAKWYNNLTK
ncbi:MAG: LCP family protein [Lachnospiraceae bacterium]|nr:LCP family protein [Lachnospiraceae bacterium]